MKEQFAGMNTYEKSARVELYYMKSAVGRQYKKNRNMELHLIR